MFHKLLKVDSHFPLAFQYPPVTTIDSLQLHLAHATFGGISHTECTDASPSHLWQKKVSFRASFRTSCSRCTRHPKQIIQGTCSSKYLFNPLSHINTSPITPKSKLPVSYINTFSGSSEGFKETSSLVLVGCRTERNLLQT